MWRLEEKLGRKGIYVRNIRLLSGGYKHRFKYDRKEKLFYVVENKRRHYFADMQRGFGCYPFGIDQRGKGISKSYCIDDLEFSKTDVVVDCGANYGDLYIWLKDKINPENYFPFEPSKDEFRSVSKNAPNSIVHNEGLGNEDATKTFYISNTDADSSFIEPARYTHTETIKTKRLDTFVKERGVTKIKLLKLEAEGFEPEILEGAKSVLPMVDYVAIDGSYERGVDEEETFTPQTNFLIENGFRMVKINMVRGTALFERKKDAG